MRKTKLNLGWEDGTVSQTRKFGVADSGKFSALEATPSVSELESNLTTGQEAFHDVPPQRQKTLKSSVALENIQ